MAPLLLFIPPAVGLDPLDMKEVARLTIIQRLCSTAAAGIAHRRARLVHGPLVVWMGAIIAMASLSGGLVSEAGAISSKMLLGLFAAMALVASLLMLRQPANREDHDLTHNALRFFSRGRATIVSLSVGFLGGVEPSPSSTGCFLVRCSLLRSCTQLAIVLEERDLLRIYGEAYEL